MTVYYLAGPMTGLPDFNRAAFVEAAVFLRNEGYEVLNPVEMDMIYGSWEEAIKRPWTEHLARDVDTVVNKADAVIVLPGWEASRGANLEVRLATTFGKPVYRFRFHESPDGVLVPGLARLSDDELYGVFRPGDVASAPPVEETELSRSQVVTAGPYVDTGADAYDADGRFLSYEDNPLRHTFSSGGIKDNRGKPQVDLLPSAPLLAIAEVLGFGARKYQPHNWRRGLPWGDTYASLQRHLLAWNAGEDMDKESGFSHLANAGCQLLFLLDFVLSGVGVETDSRFLVCEDEACDRAGTRHPASDHLPKTEAA